MIKEERQKALLAFLDKQEFVKVSDITEKIKVTEMTVRRDLKELEKQGKLIRVHGGAKAMNKKELSFFELSHIEKKNIHLKEKEEVAKKIAEQIKTGDTVFLGPGTTIELVYDYLTCDFAKFVTNSIHVFDKFKNDNRFELILIGGSYRSKTGAFVGTIANDTVASIQVHKAFIGVNGILNDAVTNSNEDEGVTQRIILQSAHKKYIIADHFKLDRQDFYKFYSLSKADYLITDSSISDELSAKYGEIIKIIH
ncbi:DeoR/GlpR transcriptional regulator [Enterococcus sp. BWB1-3]|uniref:DeoR/GlpR family DNA-binding transcription regulator n=1 Tax=unclassified Enterococcus TaxID=2608891 RepID=UPI0019224CBE|nr:MULTISPECIES: DeoR/GlpR family DNA-binding transcription regulator [unclassified Enterococcus]MBL1227780.1 DeoR/GlpR transcriptional regulator [Enterococcus sp. BWB1-3]MCB5952031.1 DeoR/GlpR family DNA-binding transcription regulator [Enterococcus sp. BWT-B8]MCB5954559.1 DeoR/GlpR family DNA-binding transcription regulator [Enterococcus sp. CWB-B31]